MPGRQSTILCSVHCHFFQAQLGPRCWDLEMRPPLSWSVASGPSRSGASPSQSHLPSMSSSSLGCGGTGVRPAAPFRDCVTELGVAASAPTLLRLVSHPTKPERRPCPLPPLTRQPTASAFCFRTAPSYPALSASQRSFSGRGFCSLAPFIPHPLACVPSHSPVVIVPTKATRTSCVHLVATSHSSPPPGSGQWHRPQATPPWLAGPLTAPPRLSGCSTSPSLLASLLPLSFKCFCFSELCPETTPSPGLIIYHHVTVLLNNNSPPPFGCVLGLSPELSWMAFVMPPKYLLLSMSKVISAFALGPAPATLSPD